MLLVLRAASDIPLSERLAVTMIPRPAGAMMIPPRWGYDDTAPLGL